MAKNAVTDWDATAANNTEIAGVNIAEGCPAAGVNDAIRTVMAQIAAWIVSVAGPLLKSGGALTGDVTTTGKITGLGTNSTVKDGAGTERYLGYRNIPLTAKSTSYTIGLADVGQGISTTAAIVIPTNATTAFAIGDTVAVFNNSGSSISVSGASGVALRLAGSSLSGSRTLAQYGFASLIKVGTDLWVMTGMGAA